MCDAGIVKLCKEFYIFNVFLNVVTQIIVNEKIIDVHFVFAR